MKTEAIILIIQTVILGITGLIVCWYTKETKRLRKISHRQVEVSQQQVKVTQEQIETMQRPFLFLIDEITDDHRSLYAENFGYGPAMNIVRVIIQPGGLMKGVRPNEPLPLRTLGPGQKTYKAVEELETLGWRPC